MTDCRRRNASSQHEEHRPISTLAIDLSPIFTDDAMTSTAIPEESLDVLVLSPHPDDAEISVGGTIMTLLSRGLRVGIADLTNGEPTPQGSPEIRQRETEAATEVLGVTWRKCLGLTNRSLQNDLESRRIIAETIRLTCPRVLLAPWSEDSHPDHVAASALVDAARFWAKLSKSDLAGQPHFPEQIYYFYSIHLRTQPQPAFVVDVSSVMDRKMEAVRCYESQMVTGRDTSFPTLLDDIRDRARYWGWAIHSAYGEPFACRETTGLPSLPEFLNEPN